jgi:hypothetical protein
LHVLDVPYPPSKKNLGPDKNALGALAADYTFPLGEGSMEGLRQVSITADLLSPAITWMSLSYTKEALRLLHTAANPAELVDSGRANRMELKPFELGAVTDYRSRLHQHIYHARRASSPTSDTLSATTLSSSNYAKSLLTQSQLSATFVC